MTPERFARGMTFDDYVKFAGSPENLSREGFDVRRFSLVRPRIDWSGFLRGRYAKARLTDSETAAITWLAAQPGGPAKILVISEDWSSDCRRDVPILQRLAEAGGLELRIFNRDGEKILSQRRPDPSLAPDGNHDLMLEFMNTKSGGEFASLPAVGIYAKDFRLLYRYLEYPAIYHKDQVRGHMQKARAGESDADRKARDGREFLAMQQSPFFDLWASAGVDEILSALYERQVLSS